MAQQSLAQLVKQKYPGSYDDIPDEELERMILEKYPEYQDLVKKSEPKLVTKPETQEKSGFWTTPLLPEMQYSLALGDYGKEFYNRMIRPISSPLGIGITAATGGLASIAPRVLGAGLLGLGGYEATQIPSTIGRLREEGLTPETGVELAERGLGLSGIFPGFRMARGAGKIPQILDETRLLTGRVGEPLGLPAAGETTSITGQPRFYQTTRGIADVEGIALQPEIETIARGQRLIRPRDPAQERPEFLELIPERLRAQPKVESIPLTRTPGEPPSVLGERLGGSRVIPRKKSIGRDVIYPTVMPKEGSAIENMARVGAKLQTGERASPSDLRVVAKAIEETEKTDIFNETWNLGRTTLASADLSAPFRQARPLVLEKEWWTSIGHMVKSVRGKGYQLVRDSIVNHKDFNQAVKSGVNFTEIGKLGKREESYMSLWAGKIPVFGEVVKASNRAHVAYLNKLRMDLFARYKKDLLNMGRDIDKDDVLARQIAGFINNTTGRGSLGSLERYAVLLNQGLFSPRLQMSRIQMMNPVNYIKTDPFVRKLYLKALFSTALTGYGMVELLRMMVPGAEVENDPRSTDFGKVKIGNTRFDPHGGFQQYFVLLAKQLTGKDISSTSGEMRDLWNPEFGGPTPTSVLRRFGYQKLHPSIQLAATLLNRQDDAGNPISVPEEVAEAFIPMVVQDMYELYKEDPDLIPVLALPTVFGAGTQVHEDRPGQSLGFGRRLGINR